MIHSTFGRELKGTGYGSIREFRNAYFDMRRKLELNAPETESELFQDRIAELMRPNVKLHFLLHHFEDYLRIVNIGVEHPLGLGLFSEQVLESCHQSFRRFYER